MKIGKILSCLLLGMAVAQAAQTTPENLSFKNELQASIDRGLEWLKVEQKTNGCWSSETLPALTAMSLMCFKGDPAQKFAKNDASVLRIGYQYLLGMAKPDGGIYQTNYATYNTALGMMALLAANQPEFEPLILKARRYLIGLQNDLGEPGKIDTEMDGGIGYGSRYKHSDMGNTLYALEAIYYSRHLVTDKGTREPELNYRAAINFLQSCQNLPEVNHQAWVSEDPKDKGGFVYYPGSSMAGGVTNATTGKVSLRSYGSISYAGMLSYLYANLSKDDQRVKAVQQWLSNNYTLQENPGMGPEGLFFYFHTMTKALSAAEIKVLELQGGAKVDWRRDLARRLLDLQKRDGAWVNDTNRWMEKDPVLTTAYTILSLEIICRSL